MGTTETSLTPLPIMDVHVVLHHQDPAALRSIVHLTETRRAPTAS